ncbi:MAG: aminotransferase class IV [Pseudomonadota bacterium]
MSDFSKGAAWIDGQIVPIAQAALPVTDWGLTHSDAVYDTVPVWQGAFFRLPDYTARFWQSVAANRLDPSQGPDALIQALHDIVAISGLRDAYVVMVSTRGRNPIQGSRDPRDCTNTLYAWAVPYVHIVKPEAALRGTSVWIAKRVRRIPEDSVNPKAKNYHWGDFTSGLFEAKDQGFETCLLLDHQGNMTEGPGFNAFAVFGNTLVTSDHGVLHGISRQTALDMAAEAGLSCETRPLPLEEFMEADEVFLTSSGGGILPVARVDDRQFSNGSAGPVSLALRERYFDWIARPAYRTEISYG